MLTVVIILSIALFCAAVSLTVKAAQFDNAKLRASESFERTVRLSEEACRLSQSADEWKRRCGEAEARAENLETLLRKINDISKR